MICNRGPLLYALDTVIRMHAVASLSQSTASPETSVKRSALIEIYPLARLRSVSSWFSFNFSPLMSAGCIVFLVMYASDYAISFTGLTRGRASSIIDLVANVSSNYIFQTSVSFR